MKAPKAGVPRLLKRSHSKVIKRSAGGFAAPFATYGALYALLFTRYVGPIAALAVLVAACFTLPIHRSVVRSDASWDHAVGSVTAPDFHAHVRLPLFAGDGIDMTIPAIRQGGGPDAVAFWFAIDALLLALVTWYWIRGYRRLDNDRRQKRFLLQLIFTIPAFAGLMAAGILSGSELGGQFAASACGTAGVIASALLVATVIGRTGSTVAVAAMAVGMGLMDVFPAWATAAAVAGVIAGQHQARSVRNRTDVVRCAGFVIGASGVAGFVANLITGHEFASAWNVAMAAAGTGAVGWALWFTLLTKMERPFELTTPLGLLELLDPTRSILERFAREAPGTFAHSLMVGHLASTAAEAIGADPLLCRVAAQYHDLGKLCRAQFFKENQRDGANVHDRLAPSLSAIVVTSHVRDGERMAKELGLPPVIQDIITQHHGTCLMQYFYFQASAGCPRRVDDSLQYQFRYPGPKPQTKEAGIMMIADSVEAASRTLTQPTRERIRELIDRIIDDRIDDHQLDECPLTLKDITVLRVTLTDVVCAVLHQRVEYPGAIADSENVVVAGARSVGFDFYEDFDPAVVFPLSEEVFGPPSLLPADYADEIGASSRRDDPRLAD